VLVSKEIVEARLASVTGRETQPGRSE
jgi:hypothetical protein